MMEPQPDPRRTVLKMRGTDLLLFSVPTISLNSGVEKEVL